MHGGSNERLFVETVGNIPVESSGDFILLSYKDMYVDCIKHVGGTGCIAPLIICLYTRRRCILNFTPRPLYSLLPRKEPPCVLRGRLCGEELESLSLLGFEPGTPSPQLVAVPITLPRHPVKRPVYYEFIHLPRTFLTVFVITGYEESRTSLCSSRCNELRLR